MGGKPETKRRRGREIFEERRIREPKSRVWTVKNAERIMRDRRAWDPLRLKLRPDVASYWIERWARTGGRRNEETVLTRRPWAL
jgi:hypothetical protein